MGTALCCCVCKAYASLVLHTIGQGAYLSCDDLCSLVEANESIVQHVKLEDPPKLDGFRWLQLASVCNT